VGYEPSDEVMGLAQDETVVSGVAGRYASALFSLAQDARQTDAVADALTRFDAMIAASPDLERLVRSPVFSAADQLKALDAILADASIGGIAANFIRLAASKRRLFFIREMVADYRKLNDAYRGVTRADVTSATALTDAHIAELKESLRAASGGREVDLNLKLDPSIIGGLIVKLGSRMVDGSLKTKLNAIRLAMKEVG
jgi:F-type H+-transporting ATPase subunit delta